jgi:predicted RNA binding protein YcfA (HicA-like mRNA interferase family)
MDSRELIRRLTAAGWIEVRQRGSHKQFKHPDRTALVTVPGPRRDIPIGTLRSIARQSGIDLESND